MYELVYAGKEVEEVVKAKFPSARITDASDYIHRERFELEVDATEDEFYPFAIKEGFARCCFGFGIMLKDPDDSGRGKEKIKKWIEQVKAEVK